MLILLNTHASQGRAAQKWGRIRDLVATPSDCIVELSDPEWQMHVLQGVNAGERHLVAAGGDGTVNLLLNLVMTSLTTEQRRSVILGALGLGSSNDFHKPFTTRLNGIPVRLNIQHCTWRDVGSLSFTAQSTAVTRYFLNNASIGLTAQANDLFNKPDRVLRELKKVNTASAILYSAFKSLVYCSSNPSRIVVDGEQAELNLTNLGVALNPHFAGDFCFPHVPNYSSGQFHVYATHDMSRVQVLRYMYALASNHPTNQNLYSWKSHTCAVQSAHGFVVEYDGETIESNKVSFSVVHEGIQVCA